MKAANMNLVDFDENTIPNDYLDLYSLKLGAKVHFLLIFKRHII
jgi:hypothetical protein